MVASEVTLLPWMVGFLVQANRSPVPGGFGDVFMNHHGLFPVIPLVQVISCSTFSWDEPY